MTLENADKKTFVDAAITRPTALIWSTYTCSKYGFSRVVGTYIRVNKPMFEISTDMGMTCMNAEQLFDAMHQ
jgi:outer membrane protein assembly factor BamA